MKYQLATEEKEILDAFERDELKSVPNVVQEIEVARQATRNTVLFFTKDHNSSN